MPDVLQWLAFVTIAAIAYGLGRLHQTNIFHEIDKKWAQHSVDRLVQNESPRRGWSRRCRLLSLVLKWFKRDRRTAGAPRNHMG
jgi:hypothetical protein